MRALPKQKGKLHCLLIICPAGSTCSPVSLWEKAGMAVKRKTHCTGHHTLREILMGYQGLDSPKAEQAE